MRFRARPGRTPTSSFKALDSWIRRQDDADRKRSRWACTPRVAVQSATERTTAPPRLTRGLKGLRLFCH